MSNNLGINPILRFFRQVERTLKSLQQCQGNILWNVCCKTEIFYRRSHNGYMKENILEMNVEVEKIEYSTFRGLSVYTCANRTCATQSEQYEAHCQQFTALEYFKESSGRFLNEIGEKIKIICMDTFPVPFMDLYIAIEIELLIKDENITTFQRTKYML